MARPKKQRKISFKPKHVKFRPERIVIDLESTINEKDPETIILTKDELETLRLKDLENINQIESAKKMNISQPTFHRTLLSARKKISDVLINGKLIKIDI